MIVGAVLAFGLGGIWYHPKVFGTTWMAAINKRAEDFGSSWPGMVSGAVYELLFAVLIASIMSLTGGGGLYLFFVILLCLVTLLGMLMGALYEGKGMQFWLINAGYQVAAITIIAVLVWLL